MEKADWPHAPPHRILESGTYMITCGTYLKLHHFKDPKRLDLLQDTLLRLAKRYEWKLQAWAIFFNHYHFIGSNFTNPASVKTFIQVFHQMTSAQINYEDGQEGRKVWHEFFDTHLTFNASYFARLNYVIKNAVHHKLVDDPLKYPWCSAAWFKHTAPTSFIKTIERFKTDKVKVYDEF